LSQKIYLDGLILLTKNPDDFVELHQQNPEHAGILLLYQDNNPDRDMSHADVVRAIVNLELAGSRSKVLAMSSTRGGTETWPVRQF
jgi:hypothetical protein